MKSILISFKYYRTTLNYILKYSLMIIILMNVVSCDHSSNKIQGYLDTRLLYVSSHFNGILTKLLVKRGQVVNAGQTLFMLEEEPEIASYKHSRAQLSTAILEKSTAQINLDYAKEVYSRRSELIKKHVIDQESVDTAKNKYDDALQEFTTASSRLASAQADVEQSYWSMGTKTVTAEKSGEVFDTYYESGELVLAGQAVLSILVPEELRVIFFITETDLVHIKLRDSIWFTIDSSNKKYHANISFISPKEEYTPPVIYSNDRRVQLVYKIEAIPDTVDIPYLHPGQPVTVVNMKGVQ